MCVDLLEIWLVDVRVSVGLVVVAVLVVMLDVLVSMLGMGVAVSAVVVGMVVRVRLLMDVFVGHDGSLSSIGVGAVSGRSRLPSGSARRCLMWRNASSRTLAMCVSCMA